MSRSYDDRIVRMGFDNAQFESGTKQTMTTLDKLNEKLKLPGASEGSKNVQTAVDSVDFSAMEKAILNIEKRFSTLGVVSMNVISKITNGITSSVAKLEAATLGQIKTGGWNRAMNIANAKFQIEGLGFAWEQVEKAVSYGVKDTAYGLDAAASAASQLAASGVDFQEVLETVNGQELTAMHKSLRAISGVAAMTNSSYEDIARIFTTVAGNGRLMGDQLLQLSSRGMNAAAKLAETLGTTEGDIRDMVSRGQIDFQTFAFAMDDAFGDHAKEANKTFTGALGNMKAALSRVGEIFSDPIINKTNTLFISLTSRIDEFKNKLKSIKVPRTLEEIEEKYAGISKNATAYEQTLKAMGDRTIKLGEDFANMWQSGIDAFSAMIKSVNLDWFDKVVEKVDKTVNKITEFFDIIKEIYGDSAEEAAASIEEATKQLVVSAEEAQAARDIIDKGMYGNGDARKNALTELFGGGDEGKKHAENVQAYIDSVVAAGWNYEQAAIQVEGANEIIAESEEDAARESKKARLKKILDEVSTSFSNLWTVAKNLGKTGSKILGSIFTAISNVFKIDLSGLTEGVSGFTGILANLSEKLVMSDDTAEVLTGILTKLFATIGSGIGIVKKAGDAAWDFVQGIGNSKTFKNIESGFDGLWEKIKKFATGGILDSAEGEVTGFFEAFSFTNVGKAISDFFGGIQLEFDKIELPEGIKNSEFFKSINDFIDKAKEIISDDSDVPTKIGNLINAIIDTLKNIKVFDAGKLALTVWAIMMLIRVCLALEDLGLFIGKLAAIPARISDFIVKLGNTFKNLGRAAFNASLAMVIKAAATAILEIVGSLIIISQIPADDIYRATTVLIVIVGALAILMKTFNRLGSFAPSIKVTLINVTAFAANLIAVASVIASIGGAVMLVASAFAIITKITNEYGTVGIGAFKTILIWLGGATVVLMALGVQLRKAYNPLTSILPMFASMALVISSLGGAVFAIASAMAIIGTLNQTGFEHALETIATVMFSIIAIFAILGMVKVSPAQLAASALAMVGFAAAMTLMVIPITMLAALPASDKAIDAVESLMGVAIVMMGGIALMSKVFSGGISKAIGLIAGVLALQILITTIVGAVIAITTVGIASPAALAQATTTLAVLIGVVGLLVLLLGAGELLSRAKSGNDDGLMAVATAFTMIAVGVYVLAAAVKVLADVVNGSGFWGAIGVLIGFTVVVAGLAVAANFFPTLIPAFKAVGEGMMKAGAGFALVGAGIFLVCAGIKILAPAIATLAVNLNLLFAVMEDHWAATLVIIGAAIVFGIIITAMLSRLEPILIALAGIVEDVVHTIASVIKAGSEKLSKWSSGLSVKAKTRIAAIITTVCAAILQASPDVLKTIGKLLIKLLAYLGEIAGDIAQGLVNLLINLINGLADAIRLNRNRIIAALYNVIGSLFILAAEVVKKMFKIAFGDKIGGWLGDQFNLDFFIDSIDDGLLTMRKEAEEADKINQDIYDSIMGIPEASEEAAKKSESMWDKFTGFLTGKTGEQEDALDSLEKKYGDSIPSNLAEYMQAMNTPKIDAESSTAWGITQPGELSVDASGMPDFEAQMQEHGWDVSGATEYSDEVAGATAVPDEYYQASNENMGGVQDAIADNERPTIEAIREHITGPSAQTLKEGRRGMYESGEWCVDGFIQYIEKVGTKRSAEAMRTLALAQQAEYAVANQIKSPSKLYYKDAEYIIQGFVNGIEQNTANATGAMGDLSTAVMNAFGDPIDYVSKIASGELVYDPHIRPVFDGSNVYRGASSINSMINGQTMTVAGFSGKLASDISTLDNSNAEIIAELRALREDMTVLGDELSDMQIVMDTGALVGATAGPMDKALGARSIRYGRG